MQTRLRALLEPAIMKIDVVISVPDKIGLIYFSLKIRLIRLRFSVVSGAARKTARDEKNRGGVYRGKKRKIPRPSPPIFFFFVFHASLD